MVKQIACPQCGSTITIDTDALLRGERFQCYKCESFISLSPESASLVRKAMETLERLKREGGYKE
jgi:transcription initiation factor IIE alpha subunit